jgi:hypothetical protein
VPPLRSARPRHRKRTHWAKAAAVAKVSATWTPAGGGGEGGVGGGKRVGRGNPPPREVFVFAPNAINIVGRGGCR